MTTPQCPETVGKSGKPLAANTAYHNYGCRCGVCTAWKAEHYAELKADGICTTCQKRDAAEGKMQCPPCRDDQTERDAKMYAERKAADRCQKCGAESLATETRCPDCSFKQYLGDREHKVKKRRESVRERIQERGDRA